MSEQVSGDFYACTMKKELASVCFVAVVVRKNVKQRNRFLKTTRRKRPIFIHPSIHLSTSRHDMTWMMVKWKGMNGNAGNGPILSCRIMTHARRSSRRENRGSSQNRRERNIAVCSTPHQCAFVVSSKWLPKLLLRNVAEKVVWIRLIQECSFW